MRIIITGGTGIIGSALVQDFIKDGHEVIVLSRNPQAYFGEMPPGVQVIGWDARTSQGWGHLVDGSTAIINLAGENLAGGGFLALIFKRWTPEQKQRIVESRLNAGRAVVQAVEAAGQKPLVVIQASAVGYYGSRGDETLTESAPPGDDFAARVCIDWENSTAAVEQMGVRRAVIRTAGVFLTLEGGAFPFMLLPYRFFVGGPIGSGRQWFSWIYIQDEVKAIRFLIDNPAGQGAFNLNAPNPIRNAEFGRILGRVLRRPSFFPVPAWVFRLLFGEKAEVLLASQRQIPQRLLDMGFQFQFPTIEPALRDLLGKS